MTFASAFLVLGLSIVLFRALKVAACAGDILAIARGASATMGSDTLNDDTKERAVREASKRLFATLALLSLRTAAAVASPIAALYALNGLGLVSADEVFAFLLRWDVALGSLAAFVLVGVFWR